MFQICQKFSRGFIFFTPAKHPISVGISDEVRFASLRPIRSVIQFSMVADWRPISLPISDEVQFSSAQETQERQSSLTVASIRGFN
jgi:hypothetical protein